MARSVLVSIVLAACGGAPVASPVAPSNAAPTVAVPTLTAADPAADQAFQATATQLAERTQRVVVGWGTIAFAARPGRYATLRPAEDAADGTGAYLLEVAGQLYLIELEYDGRTEAWGADAADGQPPAWAVRTEPAIVHTQTHRGGYERAALAVSGGKVVIVEHEVLEDGRDDPTPTREQHACPACPALTGDAGSYFVHRVAGPAATLDALLPAS